jgi:hypothetical protein
MDATKARELGLKPLKKSSGPATFRFEMNEEQAQDWFRFQEEVRALGHESGAQAIGPIALQRYMTEVRSQAEKGSKGVVT